MSLKKLETLASKLLFKNPYWEYKLDTYTLPDGSAGEYHYVHSPGAAMVIPLHDDGTITLVKQFRYLWKKASIEFPCGGVKNDDFAATARDELAEEARLSAGKIKEVAEFNPYNGASDEVCKVYLATKLTATSRARDASEEFEILRMSLNEFEMMVERGGVWDGMTLAGWMLSRKSVSDSLGTIGQ